MTGRGKKDGRMRKWKKRKEKERKRGRQGR